MFALTVKDQKGEKTDKKMKKVLEDEDKENDIKKSRSSFQSLTNSKSRRRKSHNKFEVVKRVNSM